MGEKTKRTGYFKGEAFPTVKVGNRTMKKEAVGRGGV